MVGDADTLWRLDTIPLPDEPFDWSAVDPADVAFVQEVVALSDGCCDALLDTEFRTITRRILARVAARDPGRFGGARTRLGARPSLVWLAGQANGSFLAAVALDVVVVGVVRRRELLGPRSHACSALRVSPPTGDRRWRSEPLAVGDPSLLHSGYRARLSIQRDRMLDVAERRRTWSMSEIDGGLARVDVRADTTKVVSAVKGVLTDSGRGIVMLGFGDRADDAYYVSLSIPDAHDLVHRVQLALDAPLPNVGMTLD